LGTDLYDSKKEYWSELVQIAKHMSLARTMRTLTIMGRSENDKKIDLAKLIYPAMQAADIHSLDLDIVHAGMDQRKIHMLVKDVFPKMKWKIPVAIHHKLLPGLTKPPVEILDGEVAKMSKSDPNAGIFIHNSDDEIRTKIKKGFCEEGSTENNPILEIAKHIVFHEFDTISVERPEKFGGNVDYDNFESLISDFSQKKLHPTDLKQAVGESLVKIVSPIREKLVLSDELTNLIKNSY
jgi:tyrosyl-tRNA synthetase